MQNKDLSRFLEELGLKDDYNIEEDLGEGYVKLKISEAERRQALQDISNVEDVIVELLRNSRDAGSKNIFISSQKTKNRFRLINCIDDGIGIPPRFHEMIFASRVTSKLENGKKDSFGFHGRGMALFSIRLNVDEVKIIFSDHGTGASFLIKIDLEKIPEKKDQSTYPAISKHNDSYEINGGVNNIIRNIIDFQIQNPAINFYCGTQTQILATLRKLNYKNLTGYENKDLKDIESLTNRIAKDGSKITELAGIPNDYSTLSLISRGIYGFDISERNIQRVFYDEVEPLVSVSDTIRLIAMDKAIDDIRKIDIKDKKTKKLKLGLKDETDISKIFKEEDIKDIKIFIENVINKIGKKYFIKTNNDIECYRKENILRFTVELKQED